MTKLVVFFNNAILRLSDSIQDQLIIASGSSVALVLRPLQYSVFYSTQVNHRKFDKEYKDFEQKKTFFSFKRLISRTDSRL